MTPRVRCPAVVLVLVALLWATDATAQATPDQPQRTLTALRGNLYLAQVDWRTTVVMVAADGIVVGDPIDADGAAWLRGELAARFPGRPVRYVLHSHHHFDRARGAGTFDGAETVGHRLFNIELQRARRSSQYSDVAPVTRTFDGRYRVTVGADVVEIIHTGPFHAPEMSALYFPAARVLFDVEPPAVDAVPFAFGAYSTPHDVARWLASVSALDIDVVVTGDGRTIDAGAVRALGPYLDDLIAAVTAGVAAGRTSSQLAAEVLLPRHAANPHYAARVAHIERVYRGLSLRHLSLEGSAGMNRMSTNAVYCTGYDLCEPPGGALPAGMLGLGYGFGRFGLLAEIQLGDQASGSRSSPFYDDIIANRRSRASGLMRYRLGNAAGGGVDLLGGFSFLISDTRGLDRVKNILTPIGGRHDIVDRFDTVAYTVGADLSVPINSRWTLRAPVRLTGGEQRELHPGRHDLHAGVGFAYRFARRVVVLSGEPQPVLMRLQP